MRNIRRNKPYKRGVRKSRLDGYTNLLNKYGTSRDNSTAYRFNGGEIISDIELTNLYLLNGIFSKIIDRPSEETLKHGLDIDYGNEETANYIEEALELLDYENKFVQAVKWSRLYGGSIIVMIVDDGGTLTEPLDTDRVFSVKELIVFERAVVTCNYKNSMLTREPESYTVSSIYGMFTVHRSRCLVFKNGSIPEFNSYSVYRDFGVPEYIRIRKELRECSTSSSDAVKLMERSVQPIYKMRDLASLLATDQGEDKVLRRLHVIDAARGLLNSIAIDSDGEDYDFKNFTLSGIKDILDGACNMLSAVTSIPQTILFGRSPAGQNSTGEADFENYYNMIEGIQKKSIKKNTKTLIDLLIKQGFCEGIIKESPVYKVKFTPLWSLSEGEQANIEKIRADTALVKAQTYQTYIDLQVIDPSEVRAALKELPELGVSFDEEEEFEITPEDVNFQKELLVAKAMTDPNEFT